jgi:hypothetical protein
MRSVAPTEEVGLHHGLEDLAAQLDEAVFRHALEVGEERLVEQSAVLKLGHGHPRAVEQSAADTFERLPGGLGVGEVHHRRLDEVGPDEGAVHVEVGRAHRGAPGYRGGHLTRPDQPPPPWPGQLFAHLDEA